MDTQDISILRLPQVKQITGLSRSSIYLRMSEGTFPQTISLGGARARAVGWLAGEVHQWVADRISESRPTGVDSHHGIFQKVENRTIAGGARQWPQ